MNMVEVWLLTVYYMYGGFMSNNLVKVTVNLTEENSNFLTELSNQLNINKTTVINKAIRLEKFILDVEKQEQKIYIQNKDGSRKEVIFR
jgi:outer membrane lipopolysaccharide assembly protein LptE/RlpB